MLDIESFSEYTWTMAQDASRRSYEEHDDNPWPFNILYAMRVQNVNEYRRGLECKYWKKKKDEKNEKQLELCEAFFSMCGEWGQYTQRKIFEQVQNGEHYPAVDFWTGAQKKGCR